MAEEFKFVGPRDEGDPEKKKATETLAYFRLLGRQKIEGELEKNELQLEAIRTVNQIIKLIFRYFQIEKEAQIDLDQVHFLHQEEFEEHAKTENRGLYDSVRGAIYINVNKIGNDRAHLIATLLHESLHAVSEQHFYAETNEENGIHLMDARVGLRTSSQWKSHPTKLRGLNEFLVNSMVYYSLKNVAGILEKRFGITLEDITSKPIYGSGSRHSEFFEKMIGRIAISQKIKTDIFLSDLVKSHFLGSLKMLKKIDEVFGAGSARVLGYLDASESEERGETVNFLVEEYFLKADEKRKEEIKKHLKDLDESL